MVVVELTQLAFSREKSVECRDNLLGTPGFEL